MSVTGTIGSRLYTSATPLTDIELENIGDIDAIPITVEVGLIESFEEFGRTFQSVIFQDTAGGRAYKLKGGYDDGNFAITVGQDLSDEGQALLKLHAEAADQNTYPFKIVFSGMPIEFEAVYFGAKVLSYVTQLGSINQVVRATINLK